MKRRNREAPPDNSRPRQACGCLCFDGESHHQQTGSVRQPTRERVLRTARRIGFYGLGRLNIPSGKGESPTGLASCCSRAGEPSIAILAKRSRTRPGVTPTARSSCAGIPGRPFARQGGCQVDRTWRHHPNRSHWSPRSMIVADAIDSVIARGIPVAGLIARFLRGAMSASSGSTTGRSGAPPPGRSTGSSGSRERSAFLWATTAIGTRR